MESGYVYYVKCSDEYSDTFFINGDLPLKEANEIALETINSDRYPNKVYLKLLGKIYSGIEPIRLDYIIQDKRIEEINKLNNEINKLELENAKLKEQLNIIN